jgi:hypothetical protein
MDSQRGDLRPGSILIEDEGIAAISPLLLARDAEVFNRQEQGECEK